MCTPELSATKSSICRARTCTTGKGICRTTASPQLCWPSAPLQWPRRSKCQSTRKPRVPFLTLDSGWPAAEAVPAAATKPSPSASCGRQTRGWPSTPAAGRASSANSFPSPPVSQTDKAAHKPDIGKALRIATCKPCGPSCAAATGPDKPSESVRTDVQSDKRQIIVASLLEVTAKSPAAAAKVTACRWPSRLVSSWHVSASTTLTLFATE
mmetsp:Transcript_15029/g.26726  ORF Transcript_15029/g.26726 Transcript_15029/m.26726 type:complete len:211 (+) Transcript_15029:311-943(+)